MAEVLSQNQIDALLNATLNGNKDIGTASEEKPEQKYRKYDFYSPRKFTKEHLRMLGGIIDTYARTISNHLSGLLRVNCEVEIDSIEEQRYYEFSNALTEGNVLALSHLNYGDHKEDTPVLFYVTRSVMLSMIDRLIGGGGEPEEDLPPNYCFTDLELKLYENLMRDLVSKFSWKSYIDVDFDFTRVEANPTLVHLISLDETVVIADLHVTFPNCSGQLSICLPGMMLANLFAAIQKENMAGRRGDPDDKTSEEIFDTLRESDLDVVVELCRTQLQLRDVFYLNVGDVIDLNRPTDAPIYVNIGGQRWFDGKMGVHNKKMAIKIGNTYYKPRERDVDQDG